jgi:hypothetical protein
MHLSAPAHYRPGSSPGVRGDPGFRGDPGVRGDPGAGCGSGDRGDEELPNGRIVGEPGGDDGGSGVPEQAQRVGTGGPVGLVPRDAFDGQLIEPAQPGRRAPRLDDRGGPARAPCAPGCRPARTRARRSTSGTSPACGR